MFDCSKVGKEKKTQCEHQQECMKLVQKIVDGQATEDEMKHFQDNMHECLPCEKAFDLETCLKQAVKLRIEKKCVPMSLIDCIKKSIKGPEFKTT